MNGKLEGEEGRDRLEEVEQGLRGTLDRLDRALVLCEQLQAGQQKVFDRLAQLEARVTRLDTHTGGLAKETLDVIERTDALEERLTEWLRGLAARLAQLEKGDRRDD